MLSLVELLAFEFMRSTLRFLSMTLNYLNQFKQSEEIPASIRERWASETLQLFNFKTTISGAVSLDEPVIFVANHISYIDIPLVLFALRSCSFVSKAEVQAWPLFGTAARKCSTVFVHRNSVKSRSAAKDEIRRQLQLYKKRVIIFPSGTTSIKVEEKWKSGVFQLAKELGVRIQPLRISYSHLRQVAYIDDDFFPVHLWKLGKNSGYEARVEFHPPLLVDDVGAAVEYCRSWSNSHNKDLSFVTSGFESQSQSQSQSEYQSEYQSGALNQSLT